MNITKLKETFKDTKIMYSKQSFTSNRVGLPQRETVNASFGQIAYRSWGSGPRIVIGLHGFMKTCDDFEVIGEQLANQNYHLICPDFYGCGGSECIAVDHTLNLFCSQINDLLLHHSCIFPVTIIGFSMGSIIAHHYANRNKDKVNKLILMAPSGGSQLPYYLQYCTFYPLGEVVSVVASSYFVKKHRAAATNASIQEIHPLDIAQQRSHLYTLRQIPWSTYDYTQKSHPLLLIYSENDNVVGVNPDTISHNESYVFSEYSHDEIINKKSAQLIREFLDKSFED